MSSGDSSAREGEICTPPADFMVDSSAREGE